MEPLLELTRASKTFGDVRVLRDVDLRIDRGQVRALLGQNGSGKSTLVKILAGFHEPDEGTGLRLDGQPVHFPVREQELEAAGLAFVHQDLALAVSLSILDNVSIARWQRDSRLGRRRIRWREERQRVRRGLAMFGVHADVDRPVSELRRGDRAIVAIVRALSVIPQDQPGVLVLDEPTVSLAVNETDTLFAAVRQLQADGHGVLLVSHQLGEVRAVADAVTVLRDGAAIWSGFTHQVDDAELVQLIVGETLVAQEYERAGKRAGTPVLETRGLAGRIATDVTLELHAGEVLGVAGLAGMGQAEVAELLVGARPPTGGDLLVHGEQRRWRSPRESIREGVGYLPAHRVGEGCVAEASVAHNLTLPCVQRYGRGWLRTGREREDATRLLHEFDVRPPLPHVAMGTLSGGNQQKVLLARLVLLGSSILVLNEPTQGIDVGARAQMLRLIDRLRADGVAILIVSSDYDDLSRVCDRVLILAHGQVRAELRDEEITEPAIHAACLRTSST